MIELFFNERMTRVDWIHLVGLAVLIVGSAFIIYRISRGL